LQKQHSGRKDNFHQQVELKLKENTSNMLYQEHIFYGAETWALGKLDQKYLESFKVMLKKNEDQLDRSCEKLGSITMGQEKTERPRYSK
jgi:hypothetical protein